MAEIRIDDKGTLSMLRDLVGTLRNRGPLMRQIAGDMRDAVEQNFEAEGRPISWTPLSAKTIAQREKKGTWPGKILQVSGKLAKVSSSSDNDRAIVGSNQPQAAAQQLGIYKKIAVRAHMRKVKSRDTFEKGKKGGRGKKTSVGVTPVKAHTSTMAIPPRPFLMLTRDDIEGIKSRIANYLLRK